MRLIYKGPIPRGSVDGRAFERGAPLEFPAELALALLRQRWWMPAPEPDAGDGGKETKRRKARGKGGAK